MEILFTGGSMSALLLHISRKIKEMVKICLS
ncbi:hypothetical protein J2Z37_002527 [Ammoniphilus resinae]|uniref:Uncharacterized protein n=1 Tax=Ammoniphilus resinae TaxID=861532 RepID=A0ABS4GQK3_9BACL|nr:hypothetical protein [Ammoniphilus resinae]